MNGREGDRIETENKKRAKRDRAYYLNASADILCRQAYRMVKTAYGAKEQTPDAKGMKDACAALKEAAALSASLQRDAADSGQTLRIVFEDGTEDYAL